MTVNSLGETEITNWEYRYFLKVVDEVGLDAGTSRTLPANLISPEYLSHRSPGLFRTLLAGNFITAGRQSGHKKTRLNFAIPIPEQSGYDLPFDLTF